MQNPIPGLDSLPKSRRINLLDNLTFEKKNDSSNNYHFKRNSLKNSGMYIINQNPKGSSNDL